MPIHRRALLGRIGVGSAVVGVTAGLGWSAASAAPARAPALEPSAGSWKTWLLASGDQFRAPPPPGVASSQVELRRLRDLVALRDANALYQIAYWDAGAPGYRWNEIAIDQGLKASFNNPRGARMMALLNTAIHDATVAAWDSKQAYGRSRPAEVDPSLPTVVATPSSPSYPSEHAAVAGAAQTVLSYLFPGQAGYFADMAQELASSRLLAGTEYPSDVEAGLALGRQVGASAVEWARADGSDVKWTGSVPTGPGVWKGTAPVEPLAGTWKTWGLAAGSQFRPSPPPSYDSRELADELAEIKNVKRSENMARAAFLWLHDPTGRPAPGSAPVAFDQAVFRWAPSNHHTWTDELSQKLGEYRLDTNPPRAARAYALVAVAGYEGMVASFDAKYAYWAPRPIHVDPTVTTLLPTYSHPSYPSAHSTIIGATSEVLAYLFPRDAHLFRSCADEMAASRVWAGIHFRSDCDAGLALGRAVGQQIVQRAMSDGAG